MHYEELFDSSITLEQDGQTQDPLLEIPTSKGVLLFVDPQNRPIQILQTGNLRRFSRLRTAPNSDDTLSRKTDIASLTRKLFWLACYNDFMTQIHYIRLTYACFDKTAKNWIQLPTPFMAAIDLDASLPFFYVSSNPTLSEKRVTLGLFPNRKAALIFAETLNTVYCLCRNPSLLKSTLQSSCPYLQMQHCPGPCLDPTQKERYLDRVHTLLTDEHDHVEPDLDVLHQLMYDAANTKDFEKANEFKKQIDLLAKLKKPDFCWVHNLKHLSILHVDRSFKRSVEGKRRKTLQYKWLKITSDAVYDLGDFLPESHEDINRFLEQNWTTAPKIPYTSDTGEHLGNLAHFLFRSKPPGFWLDCSDGIAADQLYSGLDEFLQPKPLSPGAEKKDAEKNSTSSSM